MVGIVSVSTTLVFNKGKAFNLVSNVLIKGELNLQSAASRSWSRNVTTDQATISFKLIGKLTSSCPMTEAGDIECSARPRHLSLRYFHGVQIEGQRKKKGQSF